MGNQSSSSSGISSSTSRSHLRKRFRSTGSLGLSKAELDKICQPSGLYPTCKWEDKAIRKLIADGKLAARMQGNEVKQTKMEHECPICFLNYTQVNQSKCCQATICTECYLQVKPQKEKGSSCPFCNGSRLSVSVLQVDPKTIQQREEEERKISQAKVLKDQTPIKSTLTDNTQEEDTSEMADLPESAGFGSTLEKNERVAKIRERTSSAVSEPSSSDGDSRIISAMAMTPKERRELEEEMKAQQLHPLSLRLEQEQAQRRIENEQAFSRSESGRLQTLRSRRDYFREALTNNMSSRSMGSDRYGGGDSSGRGQSLDDMMVLEAALMLSRQEASSDNAGPSLLFGGRGPGTRSSPLASVSLFMSEEEQMRRAIAASLQDATPSGDQDEVSESVSNPRNSSSSEDDEA